MRDAVTSVRSNSEARGAHNTRPSTNGIVLLLAYHFPPDNTAGAARPYRFYKYLPEAGLDCFVITAADVSSRPELNAEYVPDPLVLNVREGLGWQIERTIRKLFLPGATGLRWSIYAYRSARRFIANHPGRRITILSTFPPIGTPLAAFLVARRERLRWVSDYRDPMGDNPGVRVGSFKQAVTRCLEKIFIRRADLSIANTDSAQDRLKGLYPKRASRVHLIWNGFDPEHRLAPAPAHGPTYRVVSHIGTLYGDRVITELLTSIQRLISAARLDRATFCLQLIGDVELGCIPNEDFMRTAIEAGWLKVANDRLPQKDANTIMCASDGLILVQPHTLLQVPAKLYDYLQIGRPILAHIVQGSPIERILGMSGVPHRCVYSTQSREEFDAAVLEFLHTDFKTVRPSEEFELNFNGKRQVETLARLVESLY